MIAYSVVTAAFWIAVPLATLGACRAVDYLLACRDRRRAWLSRSRA